MRVARRPYRDGVFPFVPVGKSESRWPKKHLLATAADTSGISSVRFTRQRYQVLHQAYRSVGTPAAAFQAIHRTRPCGKAPERDTRSDIASPGLSGDRLWSTRDCGSVDWLGFGAGCWIPFSTALCPGCSARAGGSAQAFPAWSDVAGVALAAPLPARTHGRVAPEHGTVPELHPS